MKLLREDEMLFKINSKYQSNVTLEVVMNKMKLFDRLQIPFLILNIFGYIIAGILIGVICKWRLFSTLHYSFLFFNNIIDIKSFYIIEY